MGGDGEDFSRGLYHKARTWFSAAKDLVILHHIDFDFSNARAVTSFKGNVLKNVLPLVESTDNVFVIINTHTDPSQGTFHIEPENRASIDANEVGVSIFLLLTLL